MLQPFICQWIFRITVTRSSSWRVGDDDVSHPWYGDIFSYGTRHAAHGYIFCVVDYAPQKQNTTGEHDENDEVAKVVFGLLVVSCSRHFEAHKCFWLCFIEWLHRMYCSINVWNPFLKGESSISLLSSILVVKSGWPDTYRVAGQFDRIVWT